MLEPHQLGAAFGTTVARPRMSIDELEAQDLARVEQVRIGSSPLDGLGQLEKRPFEDTTGLEEAPRGVAPQQDLEELLRRVLAPPELLLTERTQPVEQAAPRREPSAIATASSPIVRRHSIRRLAGEIDHAAVDDEPAPVRRRPCRQLGAADRTLNLVDATAKRRGEQRGDEDDQQEWRVEVRRRGPPP